MQLVQSLVLLLWGVAFTHGSVISSPSLSAEQVAITSDEEALRIPTVHESAVMARRMLRLESIGTTSTVFPKDTSGMYHAPAGIEGQPIGLMEYFADCEPESGNPTLLAVTIATSFKNVAAGSNITLSIRYHAPAAVRMAPSGLPRFSLMGHLEDMSEADIQGRGVEKCYHKYHPEAFWTPGNDVHESKWVRMVVDQVFWFGGYGDRAYIGWIPVDVWRGVTEEEIGALRLPGEKKKSGGHL